MALSPPAVGPALRRVMRTVRSFRVSLNMGRGWLALGASRSSAGLFNVAGHTWSTGLMATVSHAWCEQACASTSGSFLTPVYSPAALTPAAEKRVSQSYGQEATP